MDNWSRLWYIRLRRDLLVLLLVGRLGPIWKPDGDNHINDVGNGLDNVNGCSNVLSLLQRHGERRGQEGAESEGC